MRPHVLALVARRVAGTMALAALALAPLAAQQINTGTPPIGLVEGRERIGLSPFFAGNVAQSFTVPTGVGALTQFQFWTSNNASNFQNLSFRAYIFAWSDALGRPTAAPIWSSGLLTGNTALPSAPQALTVAVPSLVLTSGQQYAAVLSPLGTSFPPTGATWEGLVWNARGTVNGAPADTYAGGQGWIIVTPRDAALSALQATRWTGGPPGQDFAFTATFATITPPDPGVIPEPSTWVLLGTGLAALGAYARRRRVTG